MAEQVLGANIIDPIEELTRIRGENEALLARVSALEGASGVDRLTVDPSVRPFSRRVWIMLEENTEIPPSGHFIGIHGSWVNPETLASYAKDIKAGRMTQREAQENAKENVQFEAVLRPGEEAYVPIEVLTTLGDAIVSAPVIDPGTFQITMYRDRMRLPYRLIQGKLPKK